MAKAEPIRGLDADAPLAVNSALIIRTRLEEMLAYTPYLHDAESVYELHQMRIAAKRLRYTMELFQGVYAPNADFGPRFAAALETVKALQDHLGFLHDADVLVPQLTEHLTHLLKDSFGTDHREEPVVGVHFVDFDACIGLLTLCRESRAERDAQYAKFLTDWVQWQEQAVFPNLIVLLEEAAQALPQTPAASAEETAAPAETVVSVPAIAPADQNETAHVENRPEPVKIVRHRAAPRRRRPLDGRPAPASPRRHTRTGADSSPRPPEGRS